MPPSSPAVNLCAFLTVGEAAEVLGMSPSTLWNWDRSGKLKPVRHPVNGYRLYRRCDLDALLRQVASRHAAATPGAQRP